jgi:tRNA wybutosine-synthesizing protein 3
MVVVEPKLRFGHSAVVHKSFMYVFGGWDGHITLSDLTMFDLEKNVWVVPVGIAGCIKGRYRHTALATDTSMFVFGGIDQKQERFNDIHEYVFETQTWVRLITVGNAPSPRTFH